jgi:FAD-linked sulfhydryl oxidase
MSETPSEAPSATSQTSWVKPLPPGVVIGPDGKPCKICTSSRDWKTLLKTSASTSSSTASKAGASAAAGGVSLVGAAQLTETTQKDCPADVEQLGRATWTFLHTAAAYYPLSPTPAHRTHMFNLLSALPTLYPCGVCADHLREEVRKFPPVVDGREGLSRWLCERHNEVNGRLGKEKFDCSLKRLNERWKDGPTDGSCD